MANSVIDFTIVESLPTYTFEHFLREMRMFFIFIVELGIREYRFSYRFLPRTCTGARGNSELVATASFGRNKIPREGGGGGGGVNPFNAPERN